MILQDSQFLKVNKYILLQSWNHLKERQSQTAPWDSASI